MNISPSNSFSGFGDDKETKLKMDDAGYDGGVDNNDDP